MDSEPDPIRVALDAMAAERCNDPGGPCPSCRTFARDLVLSFLRAVPDGSRAMTVEQVQREMGRRTGDA